MLVEMLEMKGALMNACLVWFASKKDHKAHGEPGPLPGSFSAANQEGSGQQLRLTVQHMELSRPMGRLWLA